MVGATVLLQTALAVAMRDQSWPVFLLVAYVVGATANHSLFLAIHEWSHNLGFGMPNKAHKNKARASPRRAASRTARRALQARRPRHERCVC